jgi:hypothetical protein
LRTGGRDVEGSCDSETSKKIVVFGIRGDRLIKPHVANRYGGSLPVERRYDV